MSCVWEKKWKQEKEERLTTEHCNSIEFSFGYELCWYAIACDGN